MGEKIMPGGNGPCKHKGGKCKKNVRRGIQHTEDVSLTYYFHVIAAKVSVM